MWARLGPSGTARALAGLMTDRLATFAALSRAHPEGVTIRIPTRDITVVSDAAAVRHVLVDAADTYAKGLGQSDAASWVGDGVLTAEGEPWSEQRRSLGPLISARRIAGLGPELAELADLHLEPWRTDRWSTLDPRTPVAGYTLGALGAALGFSPPSAEDVVECFETLQDRVMFDATTQQLLPSWVRPLNTVRARGAQRRIESMAAVSCDSMQTPRPPWATPTRLLSLLLAGYETTAATLGWAVHHLSSRPDLQLALADEADRADWTDSASLARTTPLAGDVFRETTRLKPPVWLISRRALCGDVIDGNPVRAGDDIVICTPALPEARDTSFEPGRDSARGLEFGKGPRGCPGAFLAELEARVWIATAARTVEIAPASGPPASVARMSQAPGAFTVRVRARTRSRK